MIEILFSLNWLGIIGGALFLHFVGNFAVLLLASSFKIIDPNPDRHYEKAERRYSRIVTMIGLLGVIMAIVSVANNYADYTLWRGVTEGVCTLLAGAVLVLASLWLATRVKALAWSVPSPQDGDDTTADDKDIRIFGGISLVILIVMMLLPLALATSTSN